jgi:DNA-binding NarL/FixJ family response regulator
MEDWKVIPGYENYAISKTGDVKSLRFNRILKSSNSDSGYLYVNLVFNKINKTHAVHKLVMENFGNTKPGENFVIDHIDGNKNNNKVENLQWMSVRSNTEKYYNNYDKKSEIIKLHNEGYSSKEITEKVGLHYSTVRQTILKSTS